ncbi:hypothetical protein [Microbacterium sp. Marseille-Q6648]|jgi:hypothetical protein|uniref:hypothetical protein n=1 Tax=Microbacterium sp. Marseille-Q6648 TaxID=2937991 RepID=UPI00203B66C1|nr:hypothetical protein [Microbacterium sp. Marseille-Q6648]
MSTTARGNRGRLVSIVTATILAGAAFGLAGCQTPRAEVVSDVEQGTVPAAVQIERAIRAAEARYEGMAERYADRSTDAGQPVSPHTADRMDRSGVEEDAPPAPPLVADRLAPKPQ